jgi:hypothetical protein
VRRPIPVPPGGSGGARLTAYLSRLTFLSHLSPPSPCRRSTDSSTPLTASFSPA